MTDEQRRTAIKKLIKDYTDKITVSKEAARAALIAEGIYTESGDLRPEYGGPGKKSKSAA
ncbi:hypothetical protein [Azorhizobium doebereinerae]|uniref:hypothetical protein n=1 Tax=Azorhizobium doebereinerae TaxID=281091 RepID=UPI00041AB135|nr:hypothetical protein [Azorhizobium doebereinerae]